MIVQSLLLGLHLVCVNLAAAGPLVCPLVQWRSAATGDAALARIGKQLLAASMIAFVLGGVAGFLNGLLWWNASPARLEAALGRLSSKIYFGWWELGFYVLCLAIYFAWWQWAPPRGAMARTCHAIVALLATTNLLWHFPPLMTILIHVAAHAPFGEPISASEFRTLMFSTAILPRSVHVWLASLAVGGMTLALLAVQARRTSATSSPLVEGCVTSGARIALIATLLQVLVGAWVLFTSPALEQSRLMGENIPATLLLIASVAMALWLLHLLAATASGPAETKHVWLAAVVMTAIIFTMSASLIIARGNALYAPLDFHDTTTSIH